MKREIALSGKPLDETGVAGRRPAEAVVEMREVQRDLVVRREPLEQIEQGDRIDPAGDSDEDRLAGAEHSVLVDRGANSFQKHGIDCVDANSRNQRLVRRHADCMLRSE